MAGRSKTPAKPDKPLPAPGSQLERCLKFLGSDEPWRCLPLPSSFLVLRDRLSFRMPCEQHRTAAHSETDWQTKDIHYLTLVTPSEELILGYGPESGALLDEPQFKELPFFSKQSCSHEEESQRPIAAADIDGDGNPELFIEHKDIPNCECQGDHSFNIEIWTLRGSVVERYPRDPQLVAKASGAPRETAPDAIEDLDHDGRPDFVGRRGPYAAFDLDFVTGSGVTSPKNMVTPIFALHAKTDGAYVWDDAVTRAFVKSSCPKPMTAHELSATTEAVPLADKLICARIWGTSIEDARRAAAKACEKKWTELMAALQKNPSQREQRIEEEALAANKGECRDWVNQLIEITPPTHLSAGPP